jgi:hypothetical protein
MAEMSLLFAACAAAAAAACATAVAPAFPPPGSASALDGLWTRTRYGAAAAHDGLRVLPGAESVTCEHGGWLKLKPLSCPWQNASLRLSGEDNVSLVVPGKAPVAGTFVPRSSTLCDWTDAAPGSYWEPVDGTSGGRQAPSTHDNTTGAAPYTPSCSAIKFASGEVWVRLREIKRVQLVSMSHLDVGYTGSMSYTLNSYFSTFFPRAIALQNNLTALGRPEKLHYITHSWLVYLYLHCDELPALGFTNEPVACPTPAAKAAFSAAVRAGTITWHAGPMNQQVRETPSLGATRFTKHDHFTKTGSGQTQEKLREKGGRFAGGVDVSGDVQIRRQREPLARRCLWAASQGKKTALFVHFAYKIDQFTKTGSGQA